MDFQLPFTIPASMVHISHQDFVVLVGSCFTEHIGKRMLEGKFPALVNPQGILFNPMSIASNLETAISEKKYKNSDLFSLNGVWNNWDFHSSFSHIEIEAAINNVNGSIFCSHQFLSKAKYLIVTFGSAYQYFLKPEYAPQYQGNYGVANCHKAPGKWFDKRLLSIAEMQQKWAKVINALQQFNPELNLIFTVSPVRHYRDGLMENNRSKARLLELSHALVDEHNNCHYFPAYELVIDVLRDYRFYDQDMVHPNGQAAQYVWEHFVDAYMNDETKQLLKRIQEITTASKHIERFPGTDESHKFRQTMLDKAERLQEEFEWLDIRKEIEYFKSI
jgi:hypothetical protein